MNSLIIFKNNLRFNDNPILYHGSKETNIIPIYIYDNYNVEKDLGRASKYWLYHSLKSLNTSLDNNLQYFKGNTISIVENLVKKNSINRVFCEQPFLEDDIKIYKNLKKNLQSLNIDLIFYNCSLLWDPNAVLKNDGTPYKVFTPYYKNGCLMQSNPDFPLGRPDKLNFLKINNTTSLDNLDLIDKFNWSKKFNSLWIISEDEALNRFKKFLDGPIFNYKMGRDFPALDSNSKLSPYIRFGLISVHRIWHELKKMKSNIDIEHYKSEICWREFSYYLLYHFPYIKNNNFQKKFDSFKWNNSKENFESWKKGETGFPFIDAGMKELWQTGYMHNRVRMVVASFLVKNLLIDWRLGEKWFWDCLLDADYASNIAGWQWAAGTGADAAPYFRIFNPILQGQKFDKSGKYTLHYLPELKKLPLKLIQTPWDTDINCNYPKPIIDYKSSRKSALERYNEIR